MSKGEVGKRKANKAECRGRTCPESGNGNRDRKKNSIAKCSVCFNFASQAPKPNPPFCPSSAQDSPTSRSQKKRTGKEKSKKMKLIVNLKKQSRKDGAYPLKVIDLLCRRYHISSPNSSVWSDALPAGSFSSSSYPTVVSFACTSTCPSPSPCTPWPCI